SGGITVKAEPVDLFKLIDEAASMVRGDAARKKIELRVQGESTMLMGDELRLVQVVTNLISNAIKYSPENSVIDINLNKEADGKVMVSVADCGRGVPQDKIDTIFDRYQQVRRDDEKLGAGLGLAISK